MNRQNDACVVLCTAPDESLAKQLAKGLVENELAACVQLIKDVSSFYQWNNELVEDKECQIVIKTRLSHVDEALEYVLSHHPYDVPEWVVLDATTSKPYMNWIKSSLK